MLAGGAAADFFHLTMWPVKRPPRELAGLLAIAAIVGWGIAAAPARAAGSYPHCSFGRICFYSDLNYTGPLLAIRQKASGQWWILPGDQTSSWVNNGSTQYCVMDQRTGLPDEKLWTMPANGGHSSWVGSSLNDRADYYRTC